MNAMALSPQDQPQPAPRSVEAMAQGSSFYAAMRLMPKAERDAMFAIYAFCRAVDDIADDGSMEREERRGQLDGWRADLRSLYAGGAPGRADFLVEPVTRWVAAIWVAKRVPLIISLTLGFRDLATAWLWRLGSVQTGWSH